MGWQPAGAFREHGGWTLTEAGVRLLAHAEAIEASVKAAGWTEYVAVETGRLEIALDRSDVHVLEPSDALYYESDIVHAFRNVSDDTTIAYILMTACKA